MAFPVARDKIPYEQQASGTNSFRKNGIAESHPYKTAWAQPTPERTSMARVGQFSAQAPHSMQPSRSASMALPFS
jgi:hypothetical protein